MSENSLVWNFIARDKASKVIDTLGGKVGALGKSVVLGLGKLAVAAAAGLTVALFRGVSSAEKLQKSMELLHTQAGVSQAALGGLTTGVLNLSGQVGVSALDLSQGLYHIESSFASTGITGKQAMELLRVSAEGARLGGANLVDVTNALDAAVVANIPGVKDLSGAMGILNATVGAGDMSMQDLSEAMGGGVIAVVKGFGLSILDVGAALAVFGDNNIRGADAGTALRMAVQALAHPVAGAKTELEKLGLTTSSLAVDMQKGGLNLALKDLVGKMDKAGVSAKQQGQVITDLFGKKAGTGVNVLVSQFDRLQSKYVDLAKGSKTFGQSWKDLQGTFDQAKARLLAGFDSILTSLGMKLLPSLTAITNWAADRLPRAFNSASAAVSDLIHKVDWSRLLDGLKGAVARVDWSALASGARHAAGAAQSELGKIDFSGIGRNLQTQARSWGGAIISGVRTGLDTGNWSALGETIGKGISSALNGIGRFLLASNDKLTKTFSDIFEKIDWVGIGITLGHQAPTLLTGLVVGLLNFDLFAILKGLAAHWQEALFAAIALAFIPAKVIGKVGEVLAKIPFVGKLLEWALLHMESFAKGLRDAVGRVLQEFGKGFLEGFRRVFPGIGESFAKWLELLPTRLGLLIIEINIRIAQMMAGIESGILKGIFKVGAAIGNVIAAMLRPFISAGGWLIARGVEFVTGLDLGISQRARAIGGWIADVISKLTSPFLKAGGWLIGHGAELVRGLLDGATGALRAVGSWAENIKNTIVNWIKNKFGIQSPSKVFMALGGHMITGLIQGLASKNPAGFISSIFGDVNTALGAVVSKGFVNIANLPAKAWDALSSVAGKFTSFFANLAGPAQGAIGSGVQRWAGVASQALAMAGAPQSWLPSLLSRMQRESGGNQFAVNNWDSNAKAGDPSRGLMQTIGSTFAAYAGPLAGRGIYDPLANIYAAIKYTISRYGNGPAGWNRPGGYDSGGWLMPGFTPAFNGTNEKEAIFTQRQLREFREGGGGTTIVFQHTGALIGNNVDDWIVSKIDMLKRQRRI